jgi:hypothetical protein
VSRYQIAGQSHANHKVKFGQNYCGKLHRLLVSHTTRSGNSLYTELPTSCDYKMLRTVTPSMVRHRCIEKLGPKNAGAAVGISFLSHIEAEIYISTSGLVAAILDF